MPEFKPETDIYVALIGDVAAEAQKPIAELRSAGFNVAVDLSGKKVGDQIKTAIKKGLQQVLIIGENELKTGNYNLKNLTTSQEQTADLEQIVKLLQNARH